MDRVLAAKGGDEAAFAALCEDYAPLIDSQVEKFAFATEGLGIDTDDLRQEASVAFYCAVMSYDGEQNGVSFGLYAKICIRNRMISLLRRLKTKKKRDSLSEAKSYAPPEKSHGLPFTREELHHMAEEKLTEREKTVFYMYIDGNSYREIARTLGMTTKSVDNALYRAKAKLRQGYHM